MLIVIDLIRYDLLACFVQITNLLTSLLLNLTTFVGKYYECTKRFYID